MPLKLSTVCIPLVLAGIVCLGSGCSTAPKQEDTATVRADSRSAVQYFKTHVSGLDRQLDNSAGYISYPGIGQYGIIIGGGKFGRGVVYDSNDRQVGWAYINAASAGLQLGVQGYKMLVVFQDDATLRDFQANKLTGSVGATAVAAEAGTATAASFSNGVAVYQGGQKGLMAGASVGLDYMRFEPFDG
ncbi:MAG: YSC84-related protein [Planctomycetota bacterium]|jgi:lipid-binding SYLF domain-containing protein